jgi:histidinol-phosphate/aromatic aminotransferase/cobyric acid decarboxylase-like protein
VPTSSSRTVNIATAIGAEREILKLDANETTIPPSPLVAARLQTAIQDGSVASYPDPDAMAVRQRLAEYASRPVSQVLAFNGSDATLDCAVRALTVPGDRVCICSPCYDRFRVFAATYGSTIDGIYSADPFTPDIDRLLDAIDDRMRLSTCRTRTTRPAHLHDGRYRTAAATAVEVSCSLTKRITSFRAGPRRRCLDRYDNC